MSDLEQGGEEPPPDRNKMINSPVVPSPKPSKMASVVALTKRISATVKKNLPKKLSFDLEHHAQTVSAKNGSPEQNTPSTSKPDSPDDLVEVDFGLLVDDILDLEDQPLVFEDEPPLHIHPGARDATESVHKHVHEVQPGENPAIADPLTRKINKFIAEETTYSKWCNKGTLSNLISFVLLILGVITFELCKKFKVEGPGLEASKYMLSLGLFSFAGGVTNWIAIKMLFDPIPGLYGSGVIVKEFPKIKASVRMIVLEIFLEREFLDDYIHTRARELLDTMDVKKFVLESLTHEKVFPVVQKKLREAAKGKKKVQRGLARFAQLLTTDKRLVKMILPSIARIAADVAADIVKKSEFHDFINLDSIFDEVDRLVTQKLELISPEMLKSLVERMIREHLGWLVVWGNIFGGLIGVASQAAGFGA